MKRIIGFENSNSSIKGIFGKGIPLYYPNTIERVRGSNQFNRSLGKGGGKVYEIDGHTYKVGSEDSYGSGSKDKSRYYSEQFRRESGIAFYEMCNHKDELQIVTGLPADLSNQADLVQKIKDTLLGEYKVKQGAMVKEFTVESVNVIPQPVGTLWSVLFDHESYAIKDKALLDKNFLIIDIGFGTTDIVALSASRGIDDNLTQTFDDVAMSDYIRDVYKTIQFEFPNHNLSGTGITPIQLDQMLRASNILDLPTGSIDVKEIKCDMQLTFAEKLINRLGGNAYSFDKYHEIILTGGGSIIMKDALSKVINNSRVKMVDKPALANVIGFYIMAQQVYGNGNR